jgi:hypothetical protein
METQSLEMRNIRVRTIALHRLPDRLRNLTQTCIAVSGGWNDGCAISDQHSRQAGAATQLKKSININPKTAGPEAEPQAPAIWNVINPPPSVLA